MANGKLGSAALVANIDTTVYTVPLGTVTTLTVAVVNRGGVAAQVRVAVTTAGAPALADWIEYDAVVPGGGVLERTAIACSAGEKIIVRDDKGTCSVRIHGFEETA